MSDDKDFSAQDPDLTLEKSRYADESILHSSQLDREKLEPTEGLHPVPMTLIFIFSALMFWSGMYLNEYSGDFRSDVFTYQWNPAAATKEEKAFEPIAEGRKLFAKNCTQCHQQDGQGIPGVYPPLVASEWVLGEKARIGKLLLAGMSGTVTVNGKQYTGQMPTFAHWKDRNIAAVLTYIRQEWGNDADEVPAELITQLREEVGNRSKPWKPEELLEQHPF